MSLVNAETGELVGLETPGLLAQYTTATGLELPEGLTFEDWSGVGQVLRHMERSVMWWLGDWWRYGERAYGEAASQAAPTGYSLKTVQTAAWVADQIESSRRLEDLSWSHHQAVAALAPPDADALLEKAEADGWSTRDLRQEVKRQRNALEVGARERHEPTWDEEAPETFATIVIDPPWRYDNLATRGAAEDHYETMSLDELAELKVPAADDGHLYMWVTNGFLEAGFRLLASWGFTYKTCLTWVKPQIGMGNYFRNNTEHVLFAIRGRCPTLRNDVGTWFQADRTKHSAKPESFYDLVESCSPGPWLEMFARRRRAGWHVWGNEA